MKIKSYILCAVICCFVCFFSSCITTKETRYLQDVESSYQPVGFEQYKLRIDDEISFYLMTTSVETHYLYNFGQSRNMGGRGGSSASYRIYDNGSIFIPTLGWVKIVGLTLREAEDVLRKSFLKLVPDAEVKVTLTNNYFYVQGDGGKGQYSLYKENLNIFQALAMAGDISSIGDKKQIKIIRKGADGLDYVRTFDLRDKSIIQSEYYYIQPNDVIYIPTNPNSFFRIESVSQFVSMFVAPISLVMTVVLLFKK